MPNRKDAAQGDALVVMELRLNAAIALAELSDVDDLLRVIQYIARLRAGSAE